ncbi:ATP-binding protein [Streptomyces sp. KK5PA1]|uniref:ATP-binding protein n=2 Tax=Actinacidiphila acididurans TaxID=2784346 RepID=A0ABS2TR87_9ACTN|nr:ATP-binding protein [Actinacidiphila acididurans]
MHTEDVLRAWRVPAPAKADALSIVGELISNAVRHANPQPQPGHEQSPGEPTVHGCTLNLRLMPDHLLILVYDKDRRPPVLREPSDEAESGRGLLLVAGLSAAWGYIYPTPTSGKLVWARLLITPPAQQAQVSTDRGQPQRYETPRERQRPGSHPVPGPASPSRVTGAAPTRTTQNPSAVPAGPTGSRPTLETPTTIHFSYRTVPCPTPPSPAVRPSARP